MMINTRTVPAEKASAFLAIAANHPQDVWYACRVRMFLCAGQEYMIPESADGELVAAGILDGGGDGAGLIAR